MNYKGIYDRLIERGKRTLIHGYQERHHIVPKCLGGDNSADNLVYLTPEEHFVAHQLLVKIYPGERKLIHAVNALCRSSGNQIRNNKMYSWLKQRRSDLMKEKMKGNAHAKNSVRDQNFKDNLSNLYSGVSKPDFTVEHRKNLSNSVKAYNASLTPEQRKKKPRTPEHTENWRKTMRLKGYIK